MGVLWLLGLGDAEDDGVGVGVGDALGVGVADGRGVGVGEGVPPDEPPDEFAVQCAYRVIADGGVYGEVFCVPAEAEVNQPPNV